MEILRIKEVMKMVGLSRTTIWRRIDDDDFPAQVKLGGPKTRAVGWHRAEIEGWLASRQPAKDEALPHKYETKTRLSTTLREKVRAFKVRLEEWANSPGSKNLVPVGPLRAGPLPVPVLVRRYRFNAKILDKTGDETA